MISLDTVINLLWRKFFISVLWLVRGMYTCQFVRKVRELHCGQVSFLMKDIIILHFGPTPTMFLWAKVYKNKKIMRENTGTSSHLTKKFLHFRSNVILIACAWMHRVLLSYSVCKTRHWVDNEYREDYLKIFTWYLEVFFCWNGAISWASLDRLDLAQISSSNTFMELTNGRVLTSTNK